MTKQVTFAQHVGKITDETKTLNVSLHVFNTLRLYGYVTYKNVVYVQADRTSPDELVFLSIHPVELFDENLIVVP